jgi:hypothetical protein
VRNAKAKAGQPAVQSYHSPQNPRLDQQCRGFNSPQCLPQFIERDLGRLIGHGATAVSNLPAARQTTTDRISLVWGAEKRIATKLASMLPSVES